MKTLRFLLPLTLLTLTAGCVTPRTTVRLATASRADLEAAEKKDAVWYEFEKGDTVPFQFAFFGVLEGGAEVTPLRAKQRFYLVARKNLPIAFSFDGQSFAMSQSSQSVIAVVPQEGQVGGQVGWLHYLGESGNPAAELEAISKRAQ